MADHRGVSAGSHPGGNNSSSRPALPRTASVCPGLPVKRSIALRRIEVGSAVRAASVSGFRHTDGDAALASPAVAVAGCEIDGVDATIAQIAALGAYLGGGSPDARAVRAGKTIACTVGGLVLFDLID